jgi:hypothetical protein
VYNEEVNNMIEKRIYIVEISHAPFFSEDGTECTGFRQVGYFEHEEDAKKYYSKTLKELEKRSETDPSVDEIVDDMYIYDVILNHGDSVEEILD